MIKLLRQSRIFTVLLTCLRIYIGFQWLQSGLGKILGPDAFTSSSLINGAINDSSHYPWFQSFLTFITDGGQSTAIFDFLMPWTQILIGLALMLGAFTLLAAFVGILMNFSFLLAGAVSINPTFIVIQFVILVGGFNSAMLGLDYLIVPWLRKHLPFLHNDIATRPSLDMQDFH